MTVFPTSLDTFVNPNPTDDTVTVNHAWQHDNANNAITALEAKVWIDSSAVTTSLDYKIKNSSSVDPGHHHTLSAINQSGAVANQFPMWNGSAWVPSTPAWAWDVLSTASVSVDSEMAIFSWTWWKTIKRMTGTGLVKVTSWVVSTASSWADYAPATSWTWILKGNGSWAFATATAWTDYSVPTWTETLTNKTLTSPTENYPTINFPHLNVWSDANWDMYYRDTGVLTRIPIGSTNDTLNIVWGVPTWSNPNTYTGTYVNDTVSRDGDGTLSSTTNQMLWLTTANVTLSRWTSGYAKLEYSPNNSTWTDIINQSTWWAKSFPILLRKGYYYRVTVNSTIWGTPTSASINYIL